MVGGRETRTKVRYSTNLTRDLLLGVIPQAREEIDDEIDGLLPRLEEQKETHISISIASRHQISGTLPEEQAGEDPRRNGPEEHGARGII